MSSAAKEVTRKIDRILDTRCIPRWVRSFMQKPFFESCPSHNMRKNEMNRYCINCDESLCYKYCFAGGDHDGHMILTIYRHVYHDVIPLDEMEMTTLDCSQIQPYKCNKRWILAMTPLPHTGSGSLIEGEGACVVCERKLIDSATFRLCSIKCKIESAMQVPSTYRANLIRAFDPSGVGTSGQRDPNSYRKRSRKGIPIRAPLK